MFSGQDAMLRRHPASVWTKKGRRLKKPPDQSGRGGRLNTGE
jgi:hypothetical protein